MQGLRLTARDFLGNDARMRLVCPYPSRNEGGATAPGERGEAMGIGEKVERDVRSVAEYWGRRKREFIEEPALAFEQIVRPAIYFESEPDPLVETQVNATFTEWLLFDCMLDERGTLLERYVRKPPAGVADSRLARLRQVAETHEFSEYAIMRRDPGAGTLELLDIYDGTMRTVRDARLARRDNWNEGTVSLRLGCVDDVWLPVGQTVMYDRCPFDPSWVPVDDEGATSGMRLLDLAHDVFGVDGAYRTSVNMRQLV